MKELIEQLLSTAVTSLQQQGVIASDATPRIQVDRTRDPTHGDFATNLAMLLAKGAGKPPRDMAALLIAALPPHAAVAKVEIAGPGFINLFAASDFQSQQLEAMLADGERAGVTPVSQVQTIVVDYSAPNVAKEMAVHHIRSTVIGDAVTRTLEFLGHKVIRANHIGDWGTQFGMLIAYLEKMENEHASDLQLADLEAFYREAKKHYDEDAAFAERARGYVVKLQGGDDYCLTMWRKLVAVTMEQNQRIYDRLNVSLSDADIMGESLYNPLLPQVVADLKAQGLAVEDDGAQVVFLDEFKGKDGEARGVIVQKRDGGYLYTTTDIACAKYRVETLGAERVLYFIDSRQAEHLQQAWTIARKAGYVPASVSLEHHAFGMMLGKDGRPFKTRSGGTVKLADLLSEAVERAGSLIRSKNPEISDSELATIAEAVGIGAVKYADLSKNRTTDYIFDWDNMITFDGNTAPYMQYAYTRVASLLARHAGAIDMAAPFAIEHEREQELVTQLLAFNDAVQSVAAKGMPHLMCAYLYELAGRFSSFYEACPILSAEAAVKASRLKLALLTARVLKLGLGLLGIHTLEKM